MQRPYTWILIGLILAGSSGCGTFCRNRRPCCGQVGIRGNAPRPNVAAPGNFIPPPPPRPTPPIGVNPNLPPGAVLTPPPGAPILPGVGQPSPPPIGPTNPGPPPAPTASPPFPPQTSSNFGSDPLFGGQPQYEKNWQPAEARGTPERLESAWTGTPSESKSARPEIKLFSPEPVTPDATKEQTAETKPPAFTAEPPLATIPNSPFPVGIPQFTRVNAKIATGLRPVLDGLDWLPRNEYRTVLFLRKPGESDQLDRRLSEKKGLRFLSLEISPATLTKEKVREFLDTVTSESNQPIFIYDHDGSLAASLWYLYYRQAEALTDEAAKTRARSQGLRGNPEGFHLDMWLAVQQYLNDN